MERAYSILNVKSVDDGERVIRGTATSPEPDRMGDIVEPLGVTFTNPLPLLHQHDHRAPVGTVKFNKPTKSGITFEARLPKITEPGPLKDRVDTAWGEIKSGLITAVSIGFRAMQDGIEALADGGLRYLKTEVYELSLVTVPAQANATIDVVRRLDADMRAKAALPEPEVTSPIWSPDTMEARVERQIASMTEAQKSALLDKELGPLLPGTTPDPEADAQRVREIIEERLYEQDRQEASEVRKLAGRIAQLERALPRRKSRAEYMARADAEGKAMADVIRRFVGDSIAPLRGRLDKLEKSGVSFAYDGVYEPGRTYDEGKGVTYSGAFWIAKCETKEKPGQNDDWQLAVRKGRDAKAVNKDEIVSEVMEQVKAEIERQVRK